MKKCPYCAEEIQDEAIVCRYCGKDIRVPVPPPASAPTALPERWNAAGQGFVKCPNCGLWQEDVRLWCEKCKASLKEGAPRGPSVTVSGPPTPARSAAIPPMAAQTPPAREVGRPATAPEQWERDLAEIERIAKVQRDFLNPKPSGCMRTWMIWAGLTFAASVCMLLWVLSDSL